MLGSASETNLLRVTCPTVTDQALQTVLHMPGMTMEMQTRAKTVDINQEYSQGKLLLPMEMMYLGPRKKEHLGTKVGVKTDLQYPF